MPALASSTATRISTSARTASSPLSPEASWRSAATDAARRRHNARLRTPCERQYRRVLIRATPGGPNPMRFDGTSAYVATDDLKVAVNAAIALERPLLVKGEPGTGKTVLAIEIAKALG